jgi:hypothetical protein
MAETIGIADRYSLPKRKDAPHRPHNGKRKKPFLAGVIVAIVVILAIWLFALASGGASRTESYKDVSGAAGLNASIDYDCSSSCDNKFDFNVYLFTHDGRQTNVVRPDSDGHVRLAMPEGEYVMLIGKQLGKDKEFPQEPLTLKNGKELELKLQYKEVGL